MAARESNPKLDAYFRKPAWHEESARLRAILLTTGLTEERKWAQPCYTFDGKNIAIIQQMKDFVALAFFKGALMLDPKRILDAPGPNSRSGRRIRFSSPGDVTRLTPAIRAYVREAVEIEKAGRTVGKAAAPVFVAELRAKLEEDPQFRKAFEALTPGRQRGYNLYFEGAKQSATRHARIEKSVSKIRAGKGYHEN